MGLSSILPPELLKLGEDQLRREEEQRQLQAAASAAATASEAAMRTGPDLAVGLQTGEASNQRDLPNILSSSEAPPEVIGDGKTEIAAWMKDDAGARVSLPPAVRKQLGADRSQEPATRVSKSTEMTPKNPGDGSGYDGPRARSKRPIVMEGCGNCAPNCTGTSLINCAKMAAERMSSDASEESTPANSGHRFQMEIADDGRDAKLRQLRSGSAIPGCCHQ